MISVIVIASPYAALHIFRFLEKKYHQRTGNPQKPVYKGQITCPLIKVGCKTLILGQKFNETASLIRVKEPLIIAWLAIIAAAVASKIPGIEEPCQALFSKKGLISEPGV